MTSWFLSLFYPCLYFGALNKDKKLVTEEKQRRGMNEPQPQQMATSVIHGQNQIF